MTIQTERIPADASRAIQAALAVLTAGGLVAFPTDTVYGIGSLVFDSALIESIYAAKDRPVDKAIPVLIGNPDDLPRVAASVPSMAAKLSARFWPGPLTLVMPRHPDLPDIISPAGPTVGVRVPDHPVARALLNAAGPMAVTSANLSGMPSPTTAQGVLDQLNGRIHLVLDGGPAPGGQASTVVNCLGSEPVILREGPISLKDIQFVLA